MAGSEVGWRECEERLEMWLVEETWEGGGTRTNTEACRGQSRGRGSQSGKSHEGVPYKESLVWDSSEDLLLETEECALSFAVNDGHVNAKDTQHTVRLVFYPGCLPPCCP